MSKTIKVLTVLSFAGVSCASAQSTTCINIGRTIFCNTTVPPQYEHRHEHSTIVLPLVPLPQLELQLPSQPKYDLDWTFRRDEPSHEQTTEGNDE